MISKLGALVSREVTEQVRSRLGSDDAGVRARALVVMGYLTDAVSFERQILLLKDRDARVQARALWALKQATGRSFGAEVEAWAEWFEREQVWLRKVGIPAQRKLTACSDAEALTLIRELMGHPIFRHELSATLVPVLFRENPAVVEAACVALEQLRSSCAVGYLVEGLEHAEPTCREVIHATLLRVTGLELPLDQSAWLARFSDLR